MRIPYSAPKRFVQHRWLSAYDVTISTQRLIPAYKVLYYGFMDKKDKALYQDPLKELCQLQREQKSSDTDLVLS